MPWSGERRKRRKKPKRRTCVICHNTFEDWLYTSPPPQTCRKPACRNALIAQKRAQQDMRTRVKHHVLTCAECRKEFTQTGREKNTSQRRTCSSGCEHILKSRNAKKKFDAFSSEKRAEIRQASAAAVHKSPLVGPFETNVNAKEWRLLSPEGTQYAFRNLSLFLREHEELFLAEDLQIPPGKTSSRAHSGLSKLRPEKPEKHRRRSWKGWTWNE